MPDRTINFGESETEATYQIQDTDAVDGGGNFVVARDTNANTVLLEYDPATDTWQYAGDVDMNGGNVSGVGTLTADSVSTESATVTNEVDAGSVSTESATVTNEVDAGSVNTDNLDSRQGWTDQTSSRSFNTTHSNDTGADLNVAVTVSIDSDNTRIGIAANINNTSVKTYRGSFDSGDRYTIEITVAAGDSYGIDSFQDTAGFSLFSWFEQA